jgi:hypothetical protein
MPLQLISETMKRKTQQQHFYGFFSKQNIFVLIASSPLLVITQEDQDMVHKI